MDQREMCVWSERIGKGLPEWAQWSPWKPRLQGPHSPALSPHSLLPTGELSR